MKTFKNWLKNKLRKFLEIDTDIERLRGDSIHRYNELNKKIKIINNNTHVAMDVRTHPREHSWAVVCLNTDKIPHVEFFDLSGSNPKDLIDFLRYFRNNKKYIDATPSLRQFIID